LFEAKKALNIGHCFLSSIRREQGDIVFSSPFGGEGKVLGVFCPGRVRGNKGRR
jgi:hypothetical protein